MGTKKQLNVFIDGYLLNKEPQGTTTYIKELYKEVAIMNPEIQFFIGCFEDGSKKNGILEHYSSIDLEFIQKEIKKQYSWSKSAKILTSIFKNNLEETKA